MVFREVTVVQIKEALRRWLLGEGERPIAHGVGVDRKTARRYIAAALELGIDRSAGEGQLTDELIGQVAEKVRPHRPDGHGEAWGKLLGEEERIKAWVKQDLTVVKIGVLLSRRGVVVPHRTLARFAVERCGAGRKRTTVRVDDPPPGIELQVDFGRLGLVPDGERRRVCHGLIFTAVFSRHQFVWPTFGQTTDDVISGFEAAWRFFGEVFPDVIPDNMSSIVTKAENTAPRFNDTFFEYAQSRGFVIDAARVATPTDKPRVERVVSYVQKNFFAGENFIDLADCRERAEIWCKRTAGLRIHGTTQCRPAEVFRLEELSRLGQLPGQPFDIPHWSEPKLHRDFHVFSELRESRAERIDLRTLVIGGRGAMDQEMRAFCRRISGFCLSSIDSDPICRSIWASLSSAPARLTCRPSTSPSHPSRSASSMRAMRLSRISTRRSRCAGSGQSIEQRTQACSWMHGVPKALAHVPTDTLRRSKWPRNSCHSSSVGVRYSSLGRSDRRRARKARWAWIASSG